MSAPKIGIGSMFRDSQQWSYLQINQVQRYFDQLNKYNSNITNVVCIEGGSQDNTREVLEEHVRRDERITLLNDVGENQEPVGSVDRAERIRALSATANQVLAELYKRDLDYVFWIESDLIVDNPELINQLLEGFEKNPDAGMIAPVTLLKSNPPLFYDTWGFIDKNGLNWPNNLNTGLYRFRPKGRYRPMKSIGCASLFPASSLYDFGSGAYKDMCQQVLDRGKELYADLDLEIYHPGSQWINKRWV